MNTKKEIRRKFQEAVFKRDRYICQVCGTKRAENELDAHHITNRDEMPNGGYIPENGISVCKDICHLKVEQFHISEGQSWIEGLHPNDLYLKIGSLNLMI